MRSKASGKSVDQLKAEATAKDGIRRLGKAEDVSALTLFLCSEKARHIQGTAIAVDGGATAGYY
jgi:NAD(P)-dependent dehydrogenase (short-subunit alcohol dehydrogenase family)